MGGRGLSSGGGGRSTSSGNKKFSPMSSSELKSASNAKLRESLRKLATEYYNSGKSRISFGGLSPEQAVNMLLSQKRSRSSMIKDYKSMKKTLGYK